MSSASSSRWLLACVHIALAAAGAGTPECPCISSNSNLAALIRNRTAAIGYGGQNYGINGCQRYDSNQPSFPSGCGTGASVACTIDCAANAHDYCKASWCYVDTELCALNQNKCWNAGGRMGDHTVNPSCGTRSYQKTAFLGDDVPAYYSYETCGYVDDFSFTLRGAMNKTLHVATLIGSFPVSHTQGAVQPQKPELGKIRGPMIEFFYDMAKDYYNPQPTIQVHTEWATQSSRDILSQMWNSSSSYTACALDVAVGNYDVCVADVWHTRAREDMAMFLPYLTLDKMVLVIPVEDHSFDFWVAFKKPFEPFSDQAWAVVASFLVVASIALYFTDSWDDSDDFPYPARGYRFPRFMLAVYYSTVGFFAGGSDVSTPSLASKVTKASFTFFVLVSISSYTANLATILVANAQASKINSIEDVIQQKVKTCILWSDLLSFELQALYPDLKDLKIDMAKLPSSSYAPDDVWRFMHDGSCPAAIVTDKEWIRAQSGEFAKKDCKKEAEGTLTAHESQCKKTGDGSADLTRDCTGIKQVGSPILSIPVAWPVSARVARGLRSGMVWFKSKGEWLARFKPSIPASQCAASSAQSNDDDLGMPASSMMGTFIISVAMLVIAMLIEAFEALTGRKVHEFLGYPVFERTMSGAEIQSKKNSEMMTDIGARLAEVEKHLQKTVSSLDQSLSQEVTQRLPASKEVQENLPPMARQLSPRSGNAFLATPTMTSIQPLRFIPGSMRFEVCLALRRQNVIEMKKRLQAAARYPHIG